MNESGIRKSLLDYKLFHLLCSDISYGPCRALSDSSKHRIYLWGYSLLELSSRSDFVYMLCEKSYLFYCHKTWHVVNHEIEKEFWFNCTRQIAPYTHPDMIRCLFRIYYVAQRFHKIQGIARQL